MMTMPNDNLPPHFETDLELHYDTHFCPAHADHEYDFTDDHLDDPDETCDDCIRISATCPLCLEYLASPPNAPFPD